MNVQTVAEEVTTLLFVETCFDSIDFIHFHIHSELHVSAVSILQFCSNVSLIVGLYSLVLREVQHANHGASQEEGEPQDEEPKNSPVK